MDFNKAYDKREAGFFGGGQVGYLTLLSVSRLYSIEREMLYKIFDIPMKLVRLIKMCLSETCSEVCTGRHLPNAFHIQNVLKQEDALSLMLINFALECANRKVQVIQEKLKLGVTHQLVLMLLIYC
jgi:hypothetical protein